MSSGTNRRTAQSTGPHLEVPLPAESIPVGFLAELRDEMREATRNLFGLLKVYEKWKLAHPSAEPSGLDLNDAEPLETDS